MTKLLGGLMVLLLSTTSCSVTMPSIFGTTGHYHGWVDENSSGLEYIYPWVDKEDGHSVQK